MRLILLLVCLFLSGCGQKGDLYLADPPVQADDGTQTDETEKKKDKNS